jgi:Ribonuclease 2-5A
MKLFLLPCVCALYIVHTLDNNLHFIDYHMKPYNISIKQLQSTDNTMAESKLGISQYGSESLETLPYSESNSLKLYTHNNRPYNNDFQIYDIAKSIQTASCCYNTASNINLPKIYEDDQKSSVIDTEEIVRKFLKNIDLIQINSDGDIQYKSKKVSLEKICKQPCVIEGIYLSAYKEHIPTIIRNSTVGNILMLLTVVNIQVIDLLSLEKRHIKFSYIMHLYRENREFEVTRNHIKIDNSQYALSGDIVAVYGSKNVNGINYMVKLYSNKEISAYQYEFYQIDYILIGTLILIALLFYVKYNRNIKYEKRISKNIYKGSFFDRSCLIYHVCKNIEKSDILRGSGLVSILYQGYYGLNKIIVTEYTEQYMSKNLSDESDLRYKSQTCGFFITKSYFTNNFFQNFFRTFNFNSDIQMTNHPNRYASEYERLNQKENTKSQVISDIKIMAEVLEHLHSNNIAHGRICPENIRICEGAVKVQNLIENVGWRSASQLKNMKNIKYQNTKSDDIFSFGCLVHYYLTGYHPFDLRNMCSISRAQAIPKSERSLLSNLENETIPDKSSISNSEKSVNQTETNISNSSFKIRLSDQVEHDLIYKCIIKGDIEVLKHPFFWDFKERIDFISDFSDFIETNFQLKKNFENYKELVFKGGWNEYLDNVILENVNKKRTYDFNSLSDLIRFIRNHYRHLQELQNKSFYDSYRGGIGQYYTLIFPELLMLIYRNKHIRKETVFKKYF